MVTLPPPDPIDDLPALPPPDPIEGEGRLKRFGRQALAGLLDTVTLPTGLYGLVGSGVRALGGNLPGTDAALQKTEELSNWVNEVAGTTPTADTTDAIARVAGSIAMPIPGSWFAKLAQNTNKAGKVGLNVLELLTPGTVKPSAGRYIAGETIGVGIHEAANALTGDPTYTSQLPDFGQDRPSLPALPPADPVNAPVALPPADPQDDNWSGVKVAGGAALLAAPVLWYTMRRGSGGMLRSDTIKGADPEAFVPQTATTTWEALRTQTQDASYVLSSQVGRAAGDQARKDFEQLIDLTTRAGGGAVIDSALKSGVYPGGAVRGPSMLVTQKTFQQLPPDMQELVSNGIIGQELVESRAALHRKYRDNRVTDLPGIDTQTARQWANDLQANPTAQAIAIDVRQSMRDALQFAAQEGRISQRQFHEMTEQRPNYMSMRRAGDDLSDAQFDMLLKRTEEPNMGAQEVLNPIQSAESYVSELMRRTMNNTVRRQFIDTLDNNAINNPELFRSYKRVDNYSPDAVTIYRNGEAEHYVFADPLVKKALELNPIMANSVWAAGLRSVYQQNQTGIFAPLKSVRSLIWDTIAATNYREGGRSFGLLDTALQAASNGKYALRGDLIGGTASAALGLLRTGGARLAASLAEGIEADLKSGSGIWTTLPPSMSQMIATRMRDAYLNSVYHAFEQGGRNAALLQDDMLQASQMLKKGTDLFKNTKLEQMMGSSGVTSLYRFYTGVLDTLQNAAKVQYVAENMGRAPTSTLVREARSIGGGDMSIRGLGRVPDASSTAPNLGTLIRGDTVLGAIGGGAKTVADWFPYANATLQGLTKLGSVAMRDRTNFVAGLAGSVGSIAAASAILNSGMSPEWREAYWSQPAWWRMSNIPLPIGDKWGEFITVPVPPEYTPFVAVVQNAVDQMYGLSNGQAAGLGSDMWQATTDAVGAPLPPLFNFVLSLAGGKISLEQGISQLPTSKVVPGYQHAGAVLPANITEALASILGSSSRMLLETASAFADKAGYGAPGDAAFSRGAEQLAQDTKSNVPMIGQLWAGPRDYASNEVSKQLSEKMQALDNIEAQFRNAMNRGPVGPVPITPNSAFNGKAAEMRFYLRANPAILDLKQQIKTHTNIVEGLNSTYPKTKKTNDELSGAKRALRNMREKLARQISDMEATIGRPLEQLDPSQ